MYKQTLLLSMIALSFDRKNWIVDISPAAIVENIKKSIEAICVMYSR